MPTIQWSPICVLMVAMIGFFGGSMLVKSKSQLFQRYTASLTSEQRGKYIETIRERSNIFLVGLFLGLVISGFLLSVQDRKDQTNSMCLVIGVTLVVACIYYILVPKQHYMLRVLETRTQINDWLDIYKSFRHYTYLGAVVGVVAYLIVAYTTS